MSCNIHDISKSYIQNTYILLFVDIFYGTTPGHAHLICHTQIHPVCNRLWKNYLRCALAILCRLVPDFLKLYQNISSFNQQGLEKYNDQVSKDYFRSTNHKGSEALHQLMMKKQRIFQLQVMGAERVKKSYQCSNCKETGHCIKKCTAKCIDCSAQICCTHLEKVDGIWVKRCKLTLIE